ncbi:lamin tail domain-containing protein [Saprospira sp. CCB-QB6]|uniref:lamin tail domain-containing protein n=1 Tax=Saprospira sp. CCB-QB6 TaxID=3023936 RepID=UPI00234A6540|nr:lamin tail domain-containing protein [Saprospira sp. CCB-QB6]WCL82652.1 lamin tail domain-containing protein [Saprospira sp. CCB-QB6]
MKKLSLAILALFLTVAGAEAQVVINEIMYNPPESGADTTEYIELYNAGSTAVDILGWHFTAGVSDSVEVSTVIPAGGYFVWTVNAAAFQNTYGQAADREWASGGLSNSGEAIVIADASGTVMDSVIYDDGGSWPTAADGPGHSLALCSAGLDNTDPASWTADSTNTGITVGGTALFASPGAANTTNCVVNTVLTVEFAGTQTYVDENVGTVTIDLTIQNPNATATTVEVSIAAASTAVAADYTNFSSPTTVTFPANSTTSQSFTIDIVDDADQEVLETIVFELGNATNGAVIGTNNSYTVNINANDIAAVPVPNVVITEILYDQVGTDTIEFIELYNNGSTTADLSGFYFDGVTYTVPNGTTLAAGAYWVLTLDSVALQAVTGVTANQWTSGALSNAGEDIVFYTIAGDTVDIVNYNDNSPWPLRNANVAIQLSDVNADNNDAANWCHATNNAGTTGLGDILYATPGAANTACATPGTYVYHTIDQIDDLLAGNVPAAEGDSVELRGLVYCADFRSGNGLDFALIETASTNGIRVYAAIDINNYTVNAGDSIHVFGRINNYNGLLQVLADDITLVSAGNATLSPVEVTALSEATENKFIELNNLTLVDPTQWTGTGSGFAVEATNGTDTFDLYIDNDVDLYTQPAPTGAFKVYGFGGQYDPSNPYDEGYQLLPCNSSITPLTTVSFTAAAPVRIYPNPAQDRLFVEAEAVDAIQVYNNLGQLLIRLDNLQGNRQEINLSQLEAGVYHLNIIRNGQSSSQSFIKQ